MSADNLSEPSSPEAPDIDGFHAGFWRRAVAYAIDLVVIAAAAAVIGLIFWKISPETFGNPLVISRSSLLSQEVHTEGNKSTVNLRWKQEYLDSGKVYGSCEFESTIIVLGTGIDFAIQHQLSQGGAPPAFGSLFGMPEHCKGQLRVNTTYILYILLVLFYAPYLESRPHSATVGKMLLGLKVRSAADNSNISFLRAFGRNIAEVLCLLTLTIGYLIAAFTKRKQALHDLIAGTVVTRAFRNDQRPT